MSRTYVFAPDDDGIAIDQPGDEPVSLPVGTVPEHEQKTNPHPQYQNPRAYPITITSDGQTVINLPVSVPDAARAGVYLNTTRQIYGVDWTAAGSVLTWLSVNPTLKTTDKMEIVL